MNQRRFVRTGVLVRIVVAFVQDGIGFASSTTMGGQHVPQFRPTFVASAPGFIEDNAATASSAAPTKMI
jgi:hypothetical protein